jgi:hypothetical protein
MENKYFYIKKNNAQQIVDFSEPMVTDNLGETWQDYEDNKWVLLSDEQVSFYEQHPDASPKEVWDMEIYVPVKTLEQAKQEKIWEINDYDHSDAVNSFSVNGKDMWIDAQTRQQLRISLDACRDVGRETVTKWFDGIEYTYPITQWYQMLAAVEVYASDALNVTEGHKAAVNALQTVEAVENYDYTTGYPTKLVF